MNILRKIKNAFILLLGRKAIGQMDPPAAHRNDHFDWRSLGLNRLFDSHDIDVIKPTNIYQTRLTGFIRNNLKNKNYEIL